jgi:SAM-dependent methyltransferase
VTTIHITPELELRYGCDRARLPDDLRDRFVELEHDDSARAFLEAATAAPHGPLTTWTYGVLRKLMSDYDAYGLLDMYPMHLLSTPQLARLLSDGPRGRMLDVGAGSGSVTAHAAKLFEHVTAVETSSALKRRLRKRGYAVLEHDFTYAPLPASHERYDAVLCLNVIDRCSHPRTLLKNVALAVKESGTVIVSVPLPLKPHVHVGPYTVDQEERLPEAKSMWELGVASVRQVLAAAGLEVRALSRVPYLCRGDSVNPLYSLDAAIFTCRSTARS